MVRSQFLALCISKSLTEPLGIGVELWFSLLSPITMKAKAYIDFLSTNDKTSPTYNPRLNDVVATENKSIYDRIDKCKKDFGS